MSPSLRVSLLIDIKYIFVEHAVIFVACWWQ